MKSQSRHVFTVAMAVGLLSTGFLQAAAPAAAQEGEPPTITDVSAFDVSTRDAMITWTVDRTATGQVEYGTTEALGSFSQLEPSFKWSTHVQRLTDLDPGTIYYYRVISVDKDGQEVVSGGHTFSTLRLATSDPTRPPASGIYGAAVNADSLNSSPVGGPGNQRVSYRFRATETAPLESVRVNVIDKTDPGHGAGTGGTLRITVRTDDGSKKHRPSGVVLAKTDVPKPRTGVGTVYQFDPAPQLEAGDLYHIVFSDVDPKPLKNYVSLGGLFVFDEQDRWQPFTSNTSWGQLTKIAGSGWSDYRGAGRGTITPILGLDYANGAQAGLGYMEVWDEAPATISGPRVAREVFTVNESDHLASSVSVRVKRVRGRGPLKVRLENAEGELLDSGSIPAKSINRGRPAKDGSASWAAHEFEAPLRLRAGQDYRLVLSTDEHTEYSVVAIREGVGYGFAPETYFGDGQAEYDDGSGWRPLAPPDRELLTEGDLQLYFD